MVWGDSRIFERILRLTGPVTEPDKIRGGGCADVWDDQLSERLGSDVVRCTAKLYMLVTSSSSDASR